MKLAVLQLLMGLLVLIVTGKAASDYLEEEKKGKIGYCPKAPNGLYKPPCEVACEADIECPGEEKCCEFACRYSCMPPSREKPGMCPAPLMKKLHTPLMCGSSCTEDQECDGAEKCCETGCGRMCWLPLEDKPGKCPRKQQLPQAADPSAYDLCLHDQQCPGTEKCCFTGSSMKCCSILPGARAAGPESP